MSRRKRGAFDPDYRRAGWNRSRYAPKNSNVGITQLATMFATALFVIYLFGVPALAPETKPFIQSMQGMAAGGLVAFVIFLFTAVMLLRRETKRVRQQEGIQTEAELQTPEIQARRQSAKVRAKAAGEFEHRVASVIRRLTAHDVTVVGGSGDGGVDIEVRAKERLVGIVQCKQYDERKALDPSHIRALAAVKIQRGVNTAYLVTTARFTPASRAEAEQHGVKLIDGVRLKELYADADKKIFGQAID